MTRVHILTPGFTSPNGSAFLFPLIVHRRALSEAGISIGFFKSDADLEALADCDVLAVDSKYYSPLWIPDTPSAVAALERLASRARKLFYFDIKDSTGWDHARALPLVTAYFKNQLLRDRSLYLQPHYGYRLYTDFYHRTAGVEDDDAEISEPIANPALLDKLHLGWNSSLCDYSLQGPHRLALYRRFPLAALLRFSGAMTPAAAPRPNDLSCRIATRYARNTVAWQRQAMAKRLAERLTTERVPRRAYLEEMRRAKVVPSPFGFGEICYRDYEAFQAGALVLKPDMSHMETWPDLYRDGETIVSHKWDFSDLEETIGALLADDARRIEIAQQAQDNYRRHLTGDQAAQLFVEHVSAILKVGDLQPARQAAG